MLLRRSSLTMTLSFMRFIQSKSIYSYDFFSVFLPMGFTQRVKTKGSCISTGKETLQRSLLDMSRMSIVFRNLSQRKLLVGLGMEPREFGTLLLASAKQFLRGISMQSLCSVSLMGSLSLDLKTKALDFGSKIICKKKSQEHMMTSSED